MLVNPVPVKQVIKSVIEVKGPFIAGLYLLE